MHQRVLSCLSQMEVQPVCSVLGTVLHPAHDLPPSLGPNSWEEGGTCLSPYSSSHTSHSPLLLKRERAVSYKQGCSASAGDTCWGQGGDYSTMGICTGAETGSETGFPLGRWGRWKADGCEESIYTRWNEALREMCDWGWEGEGSCQVGTQSSLARQVQMLRQIATSRRMIPSLLDCKHERCDRQVQICQRGVV